MSDPLEISNIKSLRETPFGALIIDSQGRKGIRGSVGMWTSKCRVYFYGNDKPTELDWDELVEVVPGTDIETITKQHLGG